MSINIARPGGIAVRRWLRAVVVSIMILTAAGAAHPAVPLPGDLPHGVTADGFAYLGNPAAPVTLTEYSDYL